MPRSKTAPPPPQPSADDQRMARAQAREMLTAMTMALGHKAAEPSRARQDLRGSLGSIDYVNWADREKVVNFSQRLLLLAGQYQGLIAKLVELICGDGMYPMGTTPQAKRAVEMFIEWADGGADARGLEDFAGLQRMALAMMFVDGDIAALKTIVGGEQAIQLVESLRIKTDHGPATAGAGRRSAGEKPRIVDGVELGEGDRPVAFHVSDWLPVGSSLKSTSVRIPAGDVLYMAVRQRHSQTRGVPILAGALDRLASVGECTDAVEAAVKLHAALSVFINDASPQNLKDRLLTGTQTTTTASGGSQTTNLLGFKYGSVFMLPPEGKVSTVQGTQPSATFEMFVNHMLRYAAATVGVPVEVLVADYRQANFSVSRMAEMHAENAVRPWRNLFRERFLIPIYRWRLARLVADGRLPASDLEAALAVKWPAPPRQFIDPTKEVPALREMIEQNLITKREVVERYGGDWEQIVAARAQEVRDEAAAGITPPTTPGSTVAAAEPPQEPDDQDDDRDDESPDDADD